MDAPQASTLTSHIDGGTVVVDSQRVDRDEVAEQHYWAVAKHPAEETTRFGVGVDIVIACADKSATLVVVERMPSLARSAGPVCGGPRRVDRSSRWHTERATPPDDKMHG